MYSNFDLYLSSLDMDWAIEFDASELEAVKEYFVALEFVRIFHVVTVIDVIFTTIKKIKICLRITTL